MGEFNTVGLEAVIEAFGNREQATVEAVPKMLKAGAAKTGGRYRYIWLLKCKFEVPGEKYKTKGEKIEFQTPEITATFYKRKKDAKWKADFVGTEKDKPATTWFTTVPEPAPKMTEV